MFTTALGPEPIPAATTTGEDGDEGSKGMGDSKARILDWCGVFADACWRLPEGCAVKSGDATVGSEKLFAC